MPITGNLPERESLSIPREHYSLYLTIGWVGNELPMAPPSTELSALNPQVIFEVFEQGQSTKRDVGFLRNLSLN